MTDVIRDIFNRCRALGIILEPSPDGERLVLHYDSPPPDDLRQELRQHKPEILSLLKPQPPQWHADQIAEAVRKEGICIFWSDLFGEPIAFVRDSSCKGKVPAGLVTYDDHELRELFGQGKPGISATNLKLIHEAKKAGGGHIVSHESKE